VKRFPSASLGRLPEGHGVSYTLVVGGMDQAVYDPHPGHGPAVDLREVPHGETVDRVLNPVVSNRAPKVSD
jgi:hypothetical protein